MSRSTKSSSSNSSASKSASKSRSSKPSSSSSRSNSTSMSSSSRSSSSSRALSSASALNSFKMEVASELGISNYDKIDKGQLSSRENGYVGGNMTRKMVAFAEQALTKGQSSSVSKASSVSSHK